MRVQCLLPMCFPQNTSEIPRVSIGDLFSLALLLSALCMENQMQLL